MTRLQALRGTRAAAVFSIALTCHAQTDSINSAYQELTARTLANRSAFYVYQDQDAGLNHGFPSGWFGLTQGIQIDTGCIDDPAAANGCSTDPNSLDRVRGTVMRITFAPMPTDQFAGINIEEPENWGVLKSGTGYDLQGATNLIVDVRSPDSAEVQFGMGGCTTSYYMVTPTWQTLTIPLSSLSCQPDLTNVHILFGIAADAQHDPNGATVLLDNIRYDPAPTNRSSALGFPLGNQTFGVLPIQAFQAGRVTVPADQVLRNLTTIYESALTELALLARGAPQDFQAALLIANTFDYALHHDSHGDPLPLGANGSIATHNGYEGGDIDLYNDQSLPKTGKAGDVRLAGFSIASDACGPSNFCLVLDGATGGNNAFVILALLQAYKQFQDTRFLNDARTIGNWMISNLSDNSGTGFGGYYVGYPDQGAQKSLQTGKSIENNADIFAAFTGLAEISTELGNSADAAYWTNAANFAGDFVMQLFDATNGRFNAGTVPSGTSASPGICPSGASKGNDVINTCDFLDSDTFTTLALAGSSRYFNQIDWRRPIQYANDHFAQSVTAAGTSYQGFNIVSTPTAGPNGIAWEFTGQMCVAFGFIDRLYKDMQFEGPMAQCLSSIQQAQITAPFGNQQGIVASTMQDGDALAPIDQCLSTPYQCIAERVGLAATNWLIFASRSLNVFLPPPNVTIVPGSLQQVSVGSDGSIWGINSGGAIYTYSSQSQSWQNIPGWLSQVAVGANGYVWGLNAAGDIYRFDPSTQNWDSIPGNLATIAVGTDGDAWGLNGAGQIWHFNSASQSWQGIPGALTQIAVGFDGAVWGLNAGGDIYRFNVGTQLFQQVPGSLSQIAVGTDGDVWGVNGANGIFHFNPLLQNWEEIPGSLSQISVGSATNVWGLDPSGTVYNFNSQTQNWVQIAGTLKQISAGANGAAWGVDASDNVYQFVQATQPTQTFHSVPGALTQIAVGSDGNVWGINSNNAIYHFNPLLQNWENVAGSLTQIAVGAGGNVWGVSGEGLVYRFDSTTQSWMNVPGSLSQIAVGANGEVWGINSENQIYRFDPAIQSWGWIPGSLTQLSVGADGTVWGINSENQIYRFDPAIQSWDYIPGTLSQIAVGAANAIWGINSAGEIYRFNTSTQVWDYIPGNLSHISVAFDGTAWGLSSGNQIWRFNAQAQAWDSIPGSLNQIAVAADAVIWGVNSNQSIFRFW